MRALLKLIERLFLTAGLLALLWCAYVLTDAYLAQRNAREALDSERPQANSAAPSTSGSPSTTVPSPAPRAAPRIGAPLAELSIPRVGLSAIVLHGSDEHTLRRGVGHIENTPLPGEAGNVALAGHRDSFFRPLKNVQVGDDIVLATPEDRVHYRVSSTSVVSSREVSVIAPTKNATLTLVTCYPFWFIGQAPDRFVVRATRVDDDVAATSGSPTVAAQQIVDEPVPVHPTQPQARLRTPSAPAERTSSRRAPATIPENDDEIVRATVESFRVAYNARLARHGDDAGPVTFRSCSVGVASDSASAICHGEPQSASAVASPVWVFELARNGGDWTIRSVGMK